LIGAFESGTGLFYDVQTTFKVNAMRFRRFIRHLKRQMRTDKILLICDNARFHKAKWLTAWAEAQKEWLYLAFLPAYSPDFNPIERLWRWMKTEYMQSLLDFEKNS
jgi:putative transposase